MSDKTCIIYIYIYVYAGPQPQRSFGAATLIAKRVFITQKKKKKNRRFQRERWWLRCGLFREKSLSGALRSCPLSFSGRTFKSLFHVTFSHFCCTVQNNANATLLLHLAKATTTTANTQTHTHTHKAITSLRPFLPALTAVWFIKKFPDFYIATSLVAL